MHSTCRPWEISYQKNKALYVFNANTETYDDWSDEMFNHLNRTNRQWSDILEWVQVQPSDLEVTYDALMKTTISGVRAWDLATTLDTFLMGWINKALKKKTQGIEWRCEGQRIRALEAGVPRVQGYGRCHKECGPQAIAQLWAVQRP